MKRKNNFELILFFLLGFLLSLPSVFAAGVSWSLTSQNFVNVFASIGSFIRNVMVNEYAVFALAVVFFTMMLHNIFVPLIAKIPVFSAGTTGANKYGKIVALCLAVLSSLGIFSLVYFNGGVMSLRQALEQFLGPYAILAGVIMALLMFSIIYFGFGSCDQDTRWKNSMWGVGTALIFYGWMLNQPSFFSIGWLIVFIMLLILLFRRAANPAGAGTGTGAAARQDAAANNNAGGGGTTPARYAEIHGFVRNAATNDGLNGISVTINGITAITGRSLILRRNGHYSIRNIPIVAPPVNYPVVANDPSGLYVIDPNSSPTPIINNTRVRHDIVMISGPPTPIDGEVVGTVTIDGTTTPLGNVTITVDGMHAVSDLTSGDYTIPGITPGHHVITAVCPGYNPYTGPSLHITAGGIITHDFSMIPAALGTGSVEGIVTVDGTTTQLPNVVVTINGQTDTTNPSGYYFISGIVSGNHTITATCPGYSNYISPVPVSVIVGGSLTHNFSMIPGVSSGPNWILTTGCQINPAGTPAGTNFSVNHAGVIVDAAGNPLIIQAGDVLHFEVQCTGANHFVPTSTTSNFRLVPVGISILPTISIPLYSPDFGRFATLTARDIEASFDVTLPTTLAAGNYHLVLNLETI